MKRRTFITQTALVSLGFMALSRCNLKSSKTSGSSPLIPLKTDPEGYLDLPEGFSYKIISRQGDQMTDGLRVPGRPDGMGAFEGTGQNVILIRNHENSPSPRLNSAFGAENEGIGKVEKGKLYDPGKLKKPGLGGTTTLIYNEGNQVVEKQFLSLAGTYRNCAGGITPWNSWLTCEEDVSNADDEFVERDHGFVFDVPASSDGLVNPKPILGMGRFNHEAVAVDPETGIIYQTEDRHDSLIYRFVPENRKDLHAGGKLQVLAVEGQKSLDTRNWEEKKVKLHQGMAIRWIDIDNVTPKEDDLRYRGFDLGAACFARGEGMWFSENEIYFACTSGGPKRFGQVFKIDLKTDTLELFAESEDKTVLHMCDNLTVTPWGDVMACEDNGETNRLHVIDQEGNIRLFGINRSSTSELTGAVFSPSGKTLFVNIQENGETLAITGPWEKFRV
ncbi:PhoX family protein [Sinomicrobium kalidii]|uniref:alkaline phosphatase PhoX n=1 Tax=Sinomicrobium kalidii TaxID=2900738 RepID=UPI001E386293|nr:alkaline phosphatase PhoX [Sinomicrobium kalidii]UGU17222.1 PhoX family protein [Sinomicrobium kalidii]